MLKNGFKYLPLLLLLTLSTGALAQTTVKIATIVPETSSWMKDMRAGSKEIEERTDGRVKFKYYAGGVQGSETQVLRKMRIGQLHGGAFTSGALRNFHPDAEILGLPMLFSNFDEVRFVRERLDERLKGFIEDEGYATFGFAGGGFIYLASNRAIENLTDMGGVKVWIPEGDPIARGAAEALGISPVTLPLTDVLTGLQTELIDTVMGPPVGIIVMQWNTAMSHITDLEIAYSYAALVVDGRIWKKINPEDQVIVQEVFDRVYRNFDAEGEAEAQASFQALVDDGLEPITVSDGQAAEWARLIRESNHKIASSGKIDENLLNEIECLVEAYRAGNDGAQCSQ